MEYNCPVHKGTTLIDAAGELLCAEGHGFTVSSMGRIQVPQFSDPDQELLLNSQSSYSDLNVVERYTNFLTWLFATFRTSEMDFYSSLVSELGVSAQSSVLVTGCGTGNDLSVMSGMLDHLNVSLHGQDLSAAMVLHAARRLSDRENVVELNVSNAADLPYPSDRFDVVYHFGGINYFSDRAGAISEMCRVVKDGGLVAIGDEGVAPWLRATDFGRMMIQNNSLWAAVPPLDELPPSARDVSLKWVLGNCFYFLTFRKSAGVPDIDIDVEHIGPRGGSVRTRYFGLLEGVSPQAKSRVEQLSRAQDMSVSRFLDNLIMQLDSPIEGPR